MIDGLKPYAQTKETGLPWLPAIPTHWEILPLKRIAKSWCDGPFGSGLKSSHYAAQGVRVIRLQNIGEGYFRGADAAFVSEEHQKSLGDHSVIPGDLIVAGLGDENHPTGRACVAPDYVAPAMVKADCFRFRLRQDRAIPAFAALYMTATAAAASAALATGATRQRVNLTATATRPIVLPLFPEQRLIVRFLDAHGALTDRLIRAKQRLIKLLEEQKQAIIHRAITRGLDPTVRLKPSGVPWLGDIPEHWEVMALKRIATSWCDGPFGSGLKSSHYANVGTRVIRLQNIGHGHFKNTDVVFIADDYYKTLGDHSVIAEDLIVAGLGDENHPAGRACAAPRGIEPAMVKADCFRFRLNQERAEAEFMALFLTATAVSASATLSTGATRQRINLQASAARLVLVPPKNEQREIIAEIQASTCELETTIATIGREVAFLREFRTRLVADVVTGKLDVRAAAAALPDITESEPVDEPSDGEDFDEAIDDIEDEWSPPDHSRSRPICCAE